MSNSSSLARDKRAVEQLSSRHLIEKPGAKGQKPAPPVPLRTSVSILLAPPPRRRGGFTLLELPAVRRRKRGAFTLIELLVVVAILFVLVSMLMPSIGSVREQARRAVCASNLHQWGSALTAYMGDNRVLPSTVTLFSGYYPSFVQTLDYPPGQFATWDPLSNTGGMYSLTLLLPYVGGISTKLVNGAQTVDYTDPLCPQIRGIWKCPDSDPSQVDPDSVNSGAPPAPPYGSGPASGFGCLYADYSYFARVDLWVPLSSTTGGSFATNPTELVGRIPKSRQVLMADVIYRWSGSVLGAWTFNHGLRGRASTIQQAPGIPTGLGGANELYGDMHVEWKDATAFNEPIMQNLQTTAVGVIPASRFVIGSSPASSNIHVGVSPTATTGGPFDATYYVP